jgi:ribosomal protein S18 acetylase RimI-like enzyme
MLALEEVTDRAWPAPVHERLGQHRDSPAPTVDESGGLTRRGAAGRVPHEAAWLLRAADGWTARANSALVLGDLGSPLPDAVDAITSWYIGRGLTPQITVPLPVRRDVADHLEAAGWSANRPVLVQTAHLVPPLTVTRSEDISVLDEPSSAFWAAVATFKGVLPAAAAGVVRGTGPVVFAHCLADGELAGIARGARVDDWLHVSLVHVSPALRRRGIARALTTSLAAWASQHGAHRAVLQVEDANAAAIALYADLGFTTHHRYRTYRWDASR